MGRLLLVALMATLGGCEVVALPFRVTGDVVEVLPLVGDPLAVPFKAAADVID